MKDLYCLFGFGMGVIAGALLYKHNSNVKQLVKKCEDCCGKHDETENSSQQNPQDGSSKKESKK